jgi:hypothetical protein
VIRIRSKMARNASLSSIQTGSGCGSGLYVSVSAELMILTTDPHAPFNNMIYSSERVGREHFWVTQFQLGMGRANE